MEDIDALKRSVFGEPRYRLERANVFVSADGYHYIDYLDPVDTLSPEIDESQLSRQQRDYIERTLQFNEKKFHNQANVLTKRVPKTDKAVLDIGCGGGFFLSLLKDKGASVTGIELNDARAFYAKSVNGIDVIKRTIEDAYWKRHAESFDAVTLWDVIEHVNFPRATLEYAARVLRKDGYLIVDTPCRDSFYHRFGELTYRLSRGRFPTFLNAMYSARPFGHKQIFSTTEMKALFEAVGFEVVQSKKFHELSFPYRFYLERLFKNRWLVDLMLPIVTVMLRIVPIRNKMLVVGRKK